MDTMKELYHAEAQLPERAHRKRALIAMAIIGAIGLAACIVLCTFATRRNLRLIMPLTIGVSVLSGWAVITILHGSFYRAGVRFKHSDLMLNGTREVFSGRFEKTDDVRRVGNGISVRRVYCEMDGHETALSVNEEKAALLPDAFDGTVQTVYDFIVAFEVKKDA